jgi:hypothetical protein
MKSERKMFLDGELARERRSKKVSSDARALSSHFCVSRKNFRNVSRDQYLIRPISTTYSHFLLIFHTHILYSASSLLYPQKQVATYGLSFEYEEKRE